MDRRQMSKSGLARLRKARRLVLGIPRPKEIPRTGLLFDGDDYIIKKDTDRAELVNKHFVRKDTTYSDQMKTMN